ncbi:MAG TPA: MraY family glycosyltransferase, partial [Ilumatobacteraceae bacterium]|nr:MraY family glycosyltransferase [Ilumatobacteraceae bacterium]
MTSTAQYLIVGLCAMLVTFAVTPLVIRFAKHVGWVVEPDARRVHTVTTPDVGGIAMFIGFVAALGLTRLMGGFDPLYARLSEIRGVLIAAAIIFMVGLIDDVRELSAPAKVAGTVLAGSVLVWEGVTMYYFRLPLIGVYQWSNDWLPLVTVLWLLGISQAINLIDGLDGLAAG